MRTTTVIAVLASLPLVSFAGTYAVLASESRPHATLPPVPACAPGHARNWDGWHCNDWVAIDVRTGKTLTSRADW